MKILSKYILREHISPFLGGLGIIMFVLVMDFVLQMLNLILSKGVEPFIVLKFFFLNLAWMLALAVPMACLLAGLMAFGRLTQDGEIDAAIGSGIPLIRLMVAPLLASLLLSLGMIYFSDRILPDLNYESKMLLGDIKRKKPLVAIREGVFIDDFPGLGMFIEKVDSKHNRLSGITIFDQKNRRYPRVITAKRGEMSYSKENDQLTLDLFDGNIHETDEDDPTKYTEVYFDRQTLNFGDLGMKLERRGSGHRGDRELTIADMKRLIASKDSAIVKAQKAIVTLSEKAFYSAFVPAGKRSKTAIEALAVLRHRAKATAQAIDSQRSAIEAHRRFIRKYKVEIHKKITLPLACFFFLFLGAPVGVLARKGGVGVALGLGLGFFVIYWAFLIGGEELADRGFLAPWLAMWLPNIVLGISGSAILYRTVWSSRFSGFGFIARVSAWFGGLFRRKGSSK